MISYDYGYNAAILFGGTYAAEDSNTTAPAITGAVSCWDSSVSTALDSSTNLYLHEYCFNDTWAWDGTNWSQLSPSTTPTARFGGGMAPDVNGGATLFGGCSAIGTTSNSFDCTSRSGGNVRNVYTLKKVSGAWDWRQICTPTCTPYPTAVSSFAMAHDASSATQAAFFYGGDDGSAYRSDNWVWGTSWSNPSTLSGSPGTLANYAMFPIPDSTGAVWQVGMFGGVDLRSNPGSSDYHNDLWTWSDATATWSTPCSACTGAPAARFHLMGAYDDNTDAVIIYGGIDSSGTILSDTKTLFAGHTFAGPCSGCTGYPGP
ncbi:MAG: hypothetical protein ACYDAY_07525 [Candidatus Dormibacteria bacterium]